MLIAAGIAVIGIIHFERVRFDIPAGTAGTTLLVWSRQADLGVLFAWQEMAKIRTPPVHCLCTPAEALTQLLAHSQITFEFVNSRAVEVARLRACAPDSDDPPPPPCYRAARL